MCSFAIDHKPEERDRSRKNKASRFTCVLAHRGRKAGKDKGQHEERNNRNEQRNKQLEVKEEKERKRYGTCRERRG